MVLETVDLVAQLKVVFNIEDKKRSDIIGILAVVLGMIFVVSILYLSFFYFANNVDKKQKESVEEYKVSEQSLGKSLVINTNSIKKETRYSSKIELGKACENVQNNLNISTEEAIYAVTSESQDNIDLLAKLVYAEVGNLNDEAQIATASVVLNRMNSSSFPNSLYAVIYQDGQYACTWNGAIEKEPSEQAYNNAKYVYENGSQIPANVVFQAEFIQGSGVYKQVGNTYFCYK